MVHYNPRTYNRGCEDISRETLTPKLCTKGFTLTEIIIIVGILSVGLLAFSRVFPFGFEAKRRAENYSKIAVLAQNLVENIKKDGYSLLNKNYPEESSGYGRGSGKFKEYPDFYWQVEWWQTEIPNLRKIKVRVQGKTEKEGEPSEIEIVTYLAKRE